MDITQFIEDHSPGKTEAGKMLAKLIDAVKDTGKGGSMTLVIKIEPDKTQPTALLISDEITAKLPKHERPVRKAWLTRGGLVVDFDPNTPSLPGMAVDGAGGLVNLTDEEVIAGAAHFLQHTRGVIFGPHDGDPLPVRDDDTPPEEDEEAVAEAAAEPLPEKASLSVVPDPVPDPVEDEAPADVDLASPFALATPPRKVKDQPQA